MKNEEIGALLKDLRLKHKLTQAELAEKVYVTPQAVSRWEKGINTPNLVTLVELKKLYNMSIDELLLQVEQKVEMVPPDKEHHWFLRFVLYPFVLLFLCFGFSQFYLFLFPPYAMIIVALFMAILLTGLMLLLKVRRKGPLFLITMTAFYLVNGTIYLTNKPYFDMMEMPYLMVEDTYSTGITHPNQMPIGMTYQRDGSPWLLRYYLGQNDVYLYDLTLPIREMMSVVETPEPVQHVVFTSDKAYLSCHEFEANHSNIYELDLETQELTLIHQGERVYRLVASETELYLHEPFDRIIDNQDVLYRWNGVDVELAYEFDFNIYDIVYSEGFGEFYISMIRSSGVDTRISNIGIFDEMFLPQAYVFEEYQIEFFELRVDGLRVYSVFDSELIEIFWTTVTFSGLYADIYGYHNSGMDRFLHGDLIDNEYNIVSGTIVRNKDFTGTSCVEVYWLFNTPTTIGFDDDKIYELSMFSSQIETIEIPSYARHVWLICTVPIVALILTLGAKLTFQPKKPKAKKMPSPKMTSK